MAAGQFDFFAPHAPLAELFFGSSGGAPPREGGGSSANGREAILFLAEDWDTVSSSASIVCASLCKQLARRGEKVYCAVIAEDRQKKIEASASKVTLLWPKLAAGLAPSVEFLWRVRIPADVTRVVAMSLSTSSAIGALRGRSPSLRYSLIIHRTLTPPEADLVAGHAHNADVVISIGDGIMDSMPTNFSEQRNHAQARFADIHHPMSPILVADPEAYQKATMPRFGEDALYVGIACSSITVSILRAAAYLRGIRSHNKHVRLMIIGVADAADQVHRHLGDPSFPVLSLPCARMDDVVEHLGKCALLLVPDMDEEPFNHVALFAIAKGVPFLLPRGSAIAKTVYPLMSPFVSAEQIDRMMY